VAAIAGQERAVGLVMSKIAVALWEPGRVERGAEKGSGSGHDVFRAGEHDGKITPRVETLAKMLSVIDGAKVTDNLWGERWCKLCANAMGNPVQAMTQLGSLEIAAQPRGREITIRLAAESARVGLAAGYSIPKFNGAEAKTWASADDKAVYAELDAMLVPKATSGRNWRASMAQDVAKGRRSEIEQMNGHVAARGLELGVPTPVTSAVRLGVHSRTCSATAANPTVCCSINWWSSQSFSIIKWRMPLKSAMSRPGLTGRKRSHVRAIGVMRGSTTTILAPFSRACQT